MRKAGSSGRKSRKWVFRLPVVLKVCVQNVHFMGLSGGGICFDGGGVDLEWVLVRCGEW